MASFDRIEPESRGMVVSPHREALQAAHACQRASNDCGPFAAAIVLNAVAQARIEPQALARAMDRVVWCRGLPRVRRLPGSATFPWGLTAVLREHGMEASWQILASPGRLRQGLASGELLLPVVGEHWPKPWAHVAVLVAEDPERGWGFVDPMRADGRTRWMPHATFRRRWRWMARLLVTARLPEPGVLESPAAGP